MVDINLAGRWDRRLFHSTFFFFLVNTDNTEYQTEPPVATMPSGLTRSCPQLHEWVDELAMSRTTVRYSRMLLGHTIGIVATPRETSPTGRPTLSTIISFSVNSVEPQACAEVVRQSSQSRAWNSALVPGVDQVCVS